LLCYNCVADDHVFNRCVLGKWVAFILTVGQEGSPLIEINGGNYIRAVVFAANGEYLVSGGGRERVRVWRVEDGKQMATMEAEYAQCFAVSKDGRWIAAGTNWGHVIVWDAKTYKEVFSHREAYNEINGVDFSPDSCRLVSAWRRASIWDIAARKRVQTLAHENWVTAAKYSPQGDRIATATGESVRVWDSNDGRLLVDIKVIVKPWYNTGLLWSNNHLFVISDSAIKQFEASTGSTVSEWPVPNSEGFSCIALPKHGKFIAYSTPRTVTFWDTATHTQLGLIQYPQDIRSIAVSPDDRFLEIGGVDGKITINTLFRVTVSILSRWIMVHMNNFLAPIILPCDSIPLSHIHPTFQEPDIRIDSTALHSGQRNQRANAQGLREWVKSTLACGEWKDALVVPASVSISFYSRTLVGLTLS
jgi:WD40 repeat protein